MKSFEVKALGLEEMTEKEMTTVDGGFPWNAIWKGIKYVGGLIIGWGTDKVLDRLSEGSGEEEDIYDANFFGGELEPGYCYGEKPRV